MKSVSKLGIVSIKVTPDGTTRFGDLYASTGYQRIVNGMLIEGESIDWSGAEFSTELEAALFHESIQALDSLIEGPLEENEAIDLAYQGEGVTQPVEAPQIDLLSTQKKPEVSVSITELNGAWTWEMKNFEENKNVGFGARDMPNGMMTFEASKDGTLRGHTYVEVPFMEKVGDSAAIIEIVPLKGTWSRGEDGYNLTFVSKRKNGMQTSTKATLRDDGSFIFGTSRSKFKKSKFVYSWKAKRFRF